MESKYLYSLNFLLSFFIINGSSKSLQSGLTNHSHKNATQQMVFALKNVNVIPMTMENKIIENATVVIKGKKILSINDPIPPEVKGIDGKGKWLIPGLVDRHVHNMVDINFSVGYPTKAATVFTDTQDFTLLYIARRPNNQKIS